MNYLNGGYVMIDKADSDIYAKASGALNAGKPILWYESANKCYYIDTIEKSGDDIVLTKGGLTIVITSGNVVTEVGDVNGAVLDDIVDANGNKRFIDFDGEESEITGITYTYTKASLSGTHLMLVLGCDAANTSVVANNQVLVTFKLPDYILDRISVLFGSDSVLYKSELAIADDQTNQAFNVTLNKISDGVEIRKFTTTTFTADRHVRVQIDLLIDNE